MPIEPISPQMLVELTTVFRQVRRLQIVANRATNDVLAGQYQSVFRGRGMEFEEVREYLPGDDIRSIDWNVTARSGTPYIKRFCEERELTVFLIVDVSASGTFGTGDRAKLDVIAEISALLMFSALKNNDKVGLLTFCDRPIQFHPPRKGRSNVMRLIRDLVMAQPVARETNIAETLEYFNRVQKRTAVVFLITDFIAPVPRDALAMTAQRHAFNVITVTDPREHELPDVGIVTLVDPETGALVDLDCGHPATRARFAEMAATEVAHLEQILKRIGVRELKVATRAEHETARGVPHYATALRRFLNVG